MSEARDLIGFELPAGAGEFEDEPGKEKKPNRSVGIDEMIGEGALRAWMGKTRNMDNLDDIDLAMVNKTYPAAIFYFRLAAMTGDIKWTKALETWITWAKAILAKPKRKKAPRPSTASAAFAPREARLEENIEPEGGEDEPNSGDDD